MMCCERCQIEYPEGKKFCRQCGESLKPKATTLPGEAVRCPSCGASVLPKVKFCGACGTSLVGLEPSPFEPAQAAALGTVGQVEEAVLEEQIKQQRRKILKGIAAGLGSVALLAVVIIGGLFAYRAYVAPLSPAPQETPGQITKNEKETPLPREGESQQGQKGGGQERGGMATVPTPDSPAGTEGGKGEQEAGKSDQQKGQVATALSPPETEKEKENGQEYVRQMVSYSMVEGGVSNEEKILEVKRRVEALPYPSSSDRRTARNANEKGLAYLKSGRITEAVAAFQEAYQADQADVEVVNNLGYAYLLAGDVDSAERYLLAVLVLSPGRDAAWVNLGQTYAKKGIPRAAMACFANAYRFSGERRTTYKVLQDLSEKDDDIRVIEAARQTLQLQLIRNEQKPTQEATPTPSLPPGWYDVVRSTLVLKEPHRGAVIIKRLSPQTRIYVAEARGDYARVEPVRSMPPGYVARKDIVPAQEGKRPTRLEEQGRREDEWEQRSQAQEEARKQERAARQEEIRRKEEERRQREEWQLQRELLQRGPQILRDLTR